MPKLCEFENCRKRANYGYTYGCLERCREHREDRPNASKIKCKCGKSEPSFNFPNEKKAICCSRCKENGMIDIKNKKCKCAKSRPHFNFPNEKKAICCSRCKENGMIDITNKRCKCGKAQAKFNFTNETLPICCSECREDGMIDIKNIKCKCGKRPIFNYEGKKQPICCIDCKAEDMIDIRENKCKQKNCPQRENPKYKGYCSYCFTHLFPDDPLTFQTNCKTKELAIRDYINQNFEGFICDRRLSTNHCDCTIRRRPDLRKIINETMLCIEIDENQHKRYCEMDEETRYNDLYMAYSGKWIYIRINPDTYKKGNRRFNPTTATRLVKLKTTVQEQISRIENNKNDELVERIYLYYDE